MSMAGSKTAIIGSGFMGRVHAEALRRLGCAEPVAFSHNRFEEALRDPAIGAIHICTPNAAHAFMAEAALRAGKHVLCEKPLAASSAEAARLTTLASQAAVPNGVCYNLRFYPQVQQMRALCQAGELGEILIVQGSYCQDWLLYPTDWNWRVDPAVGGPSRALADIGSHWCDMAEHVTGLRITRLCADLKTFHATRQRPLQAAETFAGKTRLSAAAEGVTVTTEDFAAVIFQMGERTRGVYTVSQVSAGAKNRLTLEIYGSKAAVAWNQERPEELWIGRREEPNGLLLKDPALLAEPARAYAALPGGHGEGYGDTFKQVFRRFYQAIEDPSAAPEYPQFADGLRQLRIVEAALESHRERGWVDVAAETGSAPLS